MKTVISMELFDLCMKTKQEFSLLHRLPVALHHVIVPFLCLTDRLEFTRVNKTICEEVLREARIISLSDGANVERFFSEDEFRDLIMSKIKDSQNQLNISSNFILDFFSFERRTTFLPTISLHRLSTNVEDLFFFFQNKIIDQLQSLDLGRITNIPLDRILLLVDFISNSVKELKELSIIGHEHDDFPPIPSLQRLRINSSRTLTIVGLHVPLLSNLRSLMLWDCDSIDDVSCLSHLYQLTLGQCSHITKISCLNRIHTIQIISCDNINDYSLSFQHSVNISLAFLMRSSKNLKLPNLDRMEKARSLSISCGNGTGLVPFTHSGKYPSTLRSLSLENVRATFLLPADHRLMSLRLSKCREVKFDHMSCIEEVLLKDCRQLKDFSGLRGNNKVVQEIRRGFCDYFHDFTHLHLHHLSQGALSYLSHHLAKPKEHRLHTIRFRYFCSWRSYDWKVISSFACNIHKFYSLHQIIIDYSNPRSFVINSFQLNQKDNNSSLKELLMLFHVEFPVQTHQIILTKKERRMTEEVKLEEKSL